MTNTRSKRTGAAALLCAVVLSGAWACSTSSAQPEEAPPEERETPAARATWVEAATIEHSSASLHLTLPGEVEGSRESLLASAQGGYVEKSMVEVGDRVKKGQVLFHIDRGLYQARLAQLQSELRAAQRELKRADALGGAIAGAERDAAQDRVTSARGSIRVAEIQASRALVRAPFEGVIAAVALEEGEVAGPGTPAARLVRLNPAKITIAVSDRDVGLLEAGTEVQVSADAVSTPLVGTIARIAPAADMETRAFAVEVEVDNAEQLLLPGMIARVQIDQSLREDALLLPQGFLVTKREANGVFVVDEGVARWRTLELGPMVRDQVVVESGLEVGDNIVVVGQRALADGDVLILSRQGTCCTDGRPSFGS